jgi:hypothetical protein
MPLARRTSSLLQTVSIGDVRAQQPQLARLAPHVVPHIATAPRLVVAVRDRFVDPTALVERSQPVGADGPGGAPKRERKLRMRAPPRTRRAKLKTPKMRNTKLEAETARSVVAPMHEQSSMPMKLLTDGARAG